MKTKMMMTGSILFVLTLFAQQAQAHKYGRQKNIPVALPDLVVLNAKLVDSDHNE